MAAEMHRLADVFGVSRQVPLSYVERAGVDGQFLGNLARDKHVVVFGGSKQGKTCLRKRCLLDDDCIVVQCANNTTIAQLYSTVLKEAGASVAQSETLTARGSHKLAVEVEGEAKVPLLAGIKGAGGVESEKETTRESVRQRFEEVPSRGVEMS